MTTIYTKYTSTKDEVKLVLDENTSFLYIYYNDICISEMKDNTWYTIKDDGDWILDALVSFAISYYTKESNSDFIDAISELD